jgi:hypothetical protein
MGADGGEHEFVAVGRRIGDAQRSSLAAGAVDVLDNDVLVQDFTHASGDHASEHVGRATGGERNDHGHRARGIVVGFRRYRERKDCRGERREDFYSHGYFLRATVQHRRNGRVKPSVRRGTAVVRS